MSDWHLRIGGLTIHVAAADTTGRMSPSPGSRQFLIDPAPADVRVHVAVGDPVDPGLLPRLFDSGGTWRLFREADARLFEFSSPSIGPSAYKTARITRDGSAVDVVLHRRYFDVTRPMDALEYPLDELVVITRLSQGRGVEIHGCGVKDADGSGYLFAGQSGAGKSTIARLWLREPGTTILSDDRVILTRAAAGGFEMHGTPWHGDAPLASPDCVRLSRVFLLRQHAQHAAAAVPRAAAAARLFAASFPPFYDPEGLDFTLQFLDALTGEVPCLELGFTPAPSLPAFVRCAGVAQRLQN